MSFIERSNIQCPFLGGSFIRYSIVCSLVESLHAIVVIPCGDFVHNLALNELARWTVD